jgi:ATP-dependent RNA helicase RhlE
VEAETTTEVQWESLGLSQTTLDLIKKAGFTKPSPIQAQSIPIALEGGDLIASAQTGSGKTASFVLPMVERFVGREGTFGLILAPTREIAQQTLATLELFAAPRGLRSAVLIGGIDMKLDMAAINSYPQILVATPGRLCDHLERGNIWLDYIQMVVLDEADRMLDMGFSDQLNRIMRDVPQKRQTLIYSATIPPNVQKLASKILHAPKRVTIGEGMSAAKEIEQRLLWMSEESKVRNLERLMKEETGSMFVFTRSKDSASRIWRSLHSRGVYDVTYIHSDRRQMDRERALAEFKEGKYRVMIATDVAARGIHVDDVAHVVNYDLPLEPEDYIHRIGRTGRKGASGIATSFATPRDRALLRDIERLLGHSIPALNNPDDIGGGSSRGGDRERSGRDSGRGGRDGGRDSGRGGARDGGRDSKGGDRGRGGSGGGKSSRAGGERGPRPEREKAPQSVSPQSGATGSSEGQQAPSKPSGPPRVITVNKPKPDSAT